jgi:uncharacterized protein (UPF0276 family)
MTVLSTPDCFALDPIPAGAGIGLKFPHLAEILESRPDVGWFEIHAENFMSPGGPSLQALEQIRTRYPISVHGVGLSIGGDEPLDETHLARLGELVRWVRPGLVSEHLAWSRLGGTSLNDLLPLPYTEATLARVSAHVDRVQTHLGRQILIENPARYLDCTASKMAEPEFLNRLARATGCGLLLDLNNVFVSACNLGFDPRRYLGEVDLTSVGEIHLAGHHERRIGNQVLRIDDHGSPVKGPVWTLHDETIRRAGPRPTLIEWDNDIPTLATLLAEALRANQTLTGVCHDVAR